MFRFVLLAGLATFQRLFSGAHFPSVLGWIWYRLRGLQRCTAGLQSDRRDEKQFDAGKSPSACALRESNGELTAASGLGAYCFCGNCAIFSVQLLRFW